MLLGNLNLPLKAYSSVMLNNDFIAGFFSSRYSKQENIEH
jgi:hypothetical protein